MKKIIIALALGGMLTGCAGFLPPQHDALLASTASCCNNLSSLPYRDLVVGQRIRDSLGPHTPVFSFVEGKSFFLPLHMVSPDRRTLVIRTYGQNMLYNRNGHVFVPRITFLTHEHRIIASVAPDFTVQGPRFTIGESAWRADVPVPQTAEFAVVHSTPKERERVMRMRDSDQAGGYLYTRTGPAGEVEVELQ